MIGWNEDLGDCPGSEFYEAQDLSLEELGLEAEMGEQIEETERMVHICSCDRKLYPQPCKSAAGFYAGYTCPEDGPYTRLTGYFSTHEEAQDEVERLTKLGDKRSYFER